MRDSTKSTPHFTSFNHLPEHELETDERTYKLRLIQIFSLIALFVVIGSLISIMTSYLLEGVGFKFSLLFEFLPYILLCPGCYQLAKKNYYRLSSWLLIIGCLLLTIVGSMFSGTDLPIMVFFIIPIALTVILLGGWETCLVVGICSIFIAGVYLARYVFGVYKQGTSSNGGQLTTGLAIALVVIPAFAALLYLSNRGVARIRQNQSLRLQRALAELEARQNTSQVVSREVLGLVGTLNSSANQQSGGSQEQLSTVTRVNSSVMELSEAASYIEELANQISTSVRRVANDNQHIEQTINRSVEQGEEGLSAVEQTVKVSAQVGQLYQQLVAKMDELNSKSANIRLILDLISTIANETHLLSLNAAIEAAGAGEYGERFAVVAQETKKLAERSTQASRQVVEIINEIEATTYDAVESAQSGYSKAKEMEEVAGRTGQVITRMRSVVEESQMQAKSIGQTVKEVRQLGEVIQSATTQQRLASQQVQEALQELAQVAQQSAQGSELLTSTAFNLEKLSHNLNLVLTN